MTGPGDIGPRARVCNAVASPDDVATPVTSVGGPARFARTKPLGSHLLVLIAATLLPMAVFAAVATALLARSERLAFERGAVDSTRALLTALDTELNGSLRTLEAIATSTTLDRDDLRAFHGELVRRLASQPRWLTIDLVLPSGRQVVNARRPFGTSLPATAERPSFDRLLATRRPVIGDLVEGPVTRRHEFSVRVPVVRHGALKYVLSGVVDPRAIGDLLTPQRFPEGWVAVVLDGRQRFVARTVALERRIGTPASESLRGALGRGSEGWFRGTTLEGADVYTAFRRSTFSGWTVAIGIPADVVQAATRGTLATMVVGMALAAALAVALALALVRRIARPIAALATAAKALERGEPPAIPATRAVAEIDALARALSDAASAVRARAEARDRLAALVQSSSDAIIAKDLDGTITSWNPAATRMFGYTEAEALGRPIDIIVPLERADEERDLRRAVAAGESLENVETVRIGAHGRRVDVSLALSPIRDAAGTIAGISTIARDIGAWKQAEERFHLAIDAAPTAMIITDERGTIRFVNSQTERTFGYTRAQLVGQPIDRLVPARLRAAHARHRTGFFHDPRRRPMGAGRDLHALHADGTEVPVEIGLSPFETAEGLFVLAAVTDITARKRVEEERAEVLLREQEARREAETANRMKDAFLATLSHELRTPLNTILGWVRLLRGTGLGPAQRDRALETVERNTRLQARMVDDLLDISRIAAGKMVLERRPIELGPLVAETVESLQPDAKARALGLDTRLDPRGATSPPIRAACARC
jgi:PAS domain S-box-containing protein